MGRLSARLEVKQFETCLKHQPMHHTRSVASPAQRVPLRMPQLPARALQPQGRQSLALAAKMYLARLLVAAQGHLAEAPPALQQGKQQTVRLLKQA